MIEQSDVVTQHETTLVCARCGSVVVGESDESARGLAWLHMQDCQGEGVL